MSQEINLYNPVEEKFEFDFSGRQILIGLMFIIVAHLIYGGAVFANSLYLKHNLNQLTVENTRITQESDVLEQQILQHENLGLKQEISKIEHLLANRNQILEKLQDDMFSTGKGYSGFFVAFARQHIQGIWLTDVTLASAGRELLLKGQAKEAHLVPKYLDRLANETLLVGTDLSNFQIFRPAEKDKPEYSADYIDFLVATDGISGAEL